MPFIGKAGFIKAQYVAGFISQFCQHESNLSSSTAAIPASPPHSPDGAWSALFVFSVHLKRTLFNDLH